jgi:broad specificity phosphatase PhoE
MCSRKLLLATITLALAAGTAQAKHHHGDDEHTAGLANTTVLLIRHAEKPAEGPDLSEFGRQRAQAYVSYFQKLTLDGASARPDAIFATKQSKSSNRPYETVQPLAQALGLATHAELKDDQFAELAASLRNQSHGRTLLICWHHGMMPQLLQALGADPSQLLPDGKWPSDEFGWLLVLSFDAQGKLTSQRRIVERLTP